MRQRKGRMGRIGSQWEWERAYEARKGIVPFSHLHRSLQICTSKITCTVQVGHGSYWELSWQGNNVPLSQGCPNIWGKSPPRLSTGIKWTPQWHHYIAMQGDSCRKDWACCDIKSQILWTGLLSHCASFFPCCKNLNKKYVSIYVPCIECIM